MCLCLKAVHSSPVSCDQWKKAMLTTRQPRARSSVRLKPRSSTQRTKREGARATHQPWLGQRWAAAAHRQSATAHRQYVSPSGVNVLAVKWWLPSTSTAMCSSGRAMSTAGQNERLIVGGGGGRLV